MKKSEYLKNRKFQIISVLAVITIVIASGMVLLQNKEKPKIEYPPEVDEGEPPTTISHTILAEMFISPDCLNCSYSEKALAALDEDEDRMIHVVHLVGEINGAAERYAEAKNGTVFPDVEFDGGYRSLIGNATYRDYRNKTLECVTREVIWANLEVKIKTSSEGYVAEVVGSLPGGSTSGILRVFLVEKISTDYTTATGEPIHNLVIQYLYNNQVILKTTEETRIELPLNYVENIENLAVVAAFYTENGHAVQAAMATL